MKKISIKEFYEALNGSDDIMFRYEADRFNDLDEDNCEFFKGDDLILFREQEEGEDVNTVYAIFGKRAFCDEALAEFIADEKCVSVAATTAGFLPDGITNQNAALAFVRKGEAYSDNGIKSLDEKDGKAILAMCEKLNKGTIYEVDEAENFEYELEKNIFTMFGIYDGKDLAGMAVCRTVPEKKFAVLSDIAVLPKYQGRGYGKRLVKMVLSTNPDFDFVYTCHNKNFKSLALAQACGFEFCGVKNFVVKEVENDEDEE